MPKAFDDKDAHGSTNSLSVQYYLIKREYFHWLLWLSIARICICMNGMSSQSEIDASMGVVSKPFRSEEGGACALCGSEPAHLMPDKANEFLVCALCYPRTLLDGDTLDSCSS